MRYAIKKPAAWLWKTDLSKEEIEQRLAAGKITGEWLVCPQGDANLAVEVSDFLTDPSVFDTPTPDVEESTTTNGPPPLPVADTPLTPNIPRRHDLDALRATAMLLGIVLHAGLAYVTFPFWPVRDTHTSAFFDVMNSALHGFRMPLFFVISGFFTAMLWRKRGLGALIKHRAKRILLPLVVLLIPIQGLTIGLAILVTVGGELAMGTKEGAVCAAARDNDVATLKRLLKEGADPDAMDSTYKVPPLNWAALNGSFEAAELLIQDGARVNIRSGDRSTPLGHASLTGRRDLAELLLEHGAEVNAVNGYGTTPLDSTKADEGTLRFVVKLMKIEVDFDRVAENQKATAKLLVAHGGKAAASLERGSTEAAAKAKPAHIENYAERSKTDSPESITERYREFISWPGFQKPIIFGHLWFLYFLCLILVPFAMWAFVAETNEWKGVPAWVLRSPGVLLWLVPLTMIPQWFNGLLHPSFGPDTSLTFFPMPHVLMLYTIYFFVGAAYFDREEVEQLLGRRWWILMPVALLVVFPVGMAAIHEPETLPEYLSERSIRFLGVFAQSLYAWLMIFGMIGLFKKIYARENKTIRYISDSSYWLYLAHIPLLFPIQYMLLSLDISAFIKMPIVCLLTTGILLLSYRFMVRYTWLGRMLNGERTRERN